MTNFYTLTLNPALDLSGHVSKVVPNEKNYVTRQRVDPGGNGINVARMMAKLGQRVHLLGFLGGPTGDEILRLLRESTLSLRITHSMTSIRGNSRTNVTITNDSDHLQTRLTFPSPNLTSGEKKRLLAQVSHLKGPGYLILGGSIPEDCSKSYLLNILEIAEKRGIAAIVDIPGQSLRSLLHMKVTKTLFLKPNQTELEILTGKQLKSKDDLRTAAQKLHSKAGAVFVSLGNHGSILVMKDRAWTAGSPKIHARGSVGAGDSMVAAIAIRLAFWNITDPKSLNNADDPILEDLLRWGTAAGAATAEAEGTALGDPARVRELVKHVKVRKF